MSDPTGPDSVRAAISCPRKNSNRSSSKRYCLPVTEFALLFPLNVTTTACAGSETEIGAVLSDPNLGLAVWAAVHGLAMLVLENVIDLGQRRAGLHVLPSRAEILLRSLFSTKRD